MTDYGPVRTIFAIVVLAWLLVSCDAQRETERTATPRIDVPSTAPAPSQPSTILPAPSLTVAPATPAPSASSATEPSPAPTQTPEPVAVHAALRVGLDYTPGTDWRVLVDSPALLELAYQPDWTPSEDPPIWSIPRVAIGVPVGFDSSSAVLTWFRSRPVDVGCPELSDPVPTRFGGLAGSGFACSGDSKGSRPLYRVATGTGAPITTASREVSGGWFLLTDGGYGTMTILFDVHGKPVVATIFGAQGHGPAQGQVNRLADTLVMDLDLRFGARS